MSSDDDIEISDEVFAGLSQTQDEIEIAIKDTITEKVLPVDAKDKFKLALDNILTPAEQNKNAVETDESEWKSTYYADTRTVESYTNLLENFDNNYTISIAKSTVRGICSRFDELSKLPEYTNNDNPDQPPDELYNDISCNIQNTMNNFEFFKPGYYKKKKQYFMSLYDYYNRSFEYAESIRKIIRNKRNELQKLNNKVDTYKQNLYIDSRKDKYENSNFDFYKYINFYILLVYYLLIISYFIFTPFFQEKKYTNFKLITFIIFYIVFPFILPYLLSLIYLGYEYIMEINNLKGEIISYPYIIEEREKYE